jgi:hypothetical protein
MPGFFEKLQAKIELFRLEQRYTRNRHRRSTFISNAVYVDGEYIYQTPNSTGSSTSTNVSGEGRRRSHDEPSSPTEEAPERTQRKRLNRFSSMPGFGSSSPKSSAQDWRSEAAGVREDR